MGNYNRVRNLVIAELEGGDFDRKTIVDTIASYNKRFPLSLEEEGLLIKDVENYFFGVKMASEDAILYAEGLAEKSGWWSEVKKEREGYYWPSFSQFIKKEEKLPETIIEKVSERADRVLDCLFDPTLNSENDRRGMVVGHVQSGKTLNYSALINKAADAGFKVIIVIAGTIEILRAQTQSRLEQAFIGQIGKEKVGVGKLRSNDTYFDRKKPIALTSVEKDFLKYKLELADNFTFDGYTAPIVLVIKKNLNVLESVNEWLDNKATDKHALLLIDDEADNASVNGKTIEEPTKINAEIRDILNKFKQCAYVGFTATPFANIFIDPTVRSDDHGADLYPKDFLIALGTPDNYMGAECIFGNDNEDGGYSEYLKNIGTLTPKKKGTEWIPENDWESAFPIGLKDSDVDLHDFDLPESLKEAIRLFLMNIAIRNLRGHRGKHNSMLVHVSRLKRMHAKVKNKINEYLKEITDNFRSYSAKGVNPASAEYLKWVKPFKEQFRLFSEEGWGQKVANGVITWEKTCEEMKISNTCVVVGAAYTGCKDIVYDKNNPINVIAVGGNSLARGFTLENLSVSYFIRNTVLCDTLMQMGRWFGYRPGYEDLCRIFMPDEYIMNFRHATIASLSLLRSISSMEKAKKTPLDFLVTVEQHPMTQLMLTAKNKSKNSEENKGVYLEGQLTENGNIPEESISDCINLIRQFILGMKGTYHGKDCAGNYFWSGIDADYIHSFLKHYPINTSGTYDQNFFLGYIMLNAHLSWDIALISQDKLLSNEAKRFDLCENIVIGKPRRKLRKKWEHPVQTVRVGVSTKEQEIAGLCFKLSEEEYEQLKTNGNREQMREKRQAPLLMILIVDVYDEVQIAIPGPIPNVPLLSISFPKSPNVGEYLTKPAYGLTFNAKLKEMIDVDRLEDENSDDVYEEEASELI